MTIYVEMREFGNCSDFAWGNRPFAHKQKYFAIIARDVISGCWCSQRYVLQ